MMCQIKLSCYRVVTLNVGCSIRVYMTALRKPSTLIRVVPIIGSAIGNSRYWSNLATIGIGMFLIQKSIVINDAHARHT